MWGSLSVGLAGCGAGEVGQCQGCWPLAMCGRVGSCLRLWTLVPGRARAWAHLWAHGAEGVLGPGACCCRIRVGGHVFTPGRGCLVLPDRCGCVVLRLVSLRRPFGCMFLAGALWRASPRWCRSARSPCRFGRLRPVW